MSPRPEKVSPRRVLRYGAIWISLIWMPVLIVVVWWLSSAGSTQAFYPPLSRILSDLRKLWFFSATRTDLVPSLINLGVGFAVASVLGVIIGALLWQSRFAAKASHGLIYFLYVLPSPALLPLFMLMFGLGPGMKIAIITYTCVWPVILNTTDGMRATDPVKFDVARTLRLGRLGATWRVALPAASPQIVAGMRSALAFGIVLMVVSEMLASTKGIGYFILKSQQTFATVDMWTGIIVLAVVGCVLNGLFVALERVALKWHYGARRAAA